MAVLQQYIARKLGVSQMTVSRVVNNRPGVGPRQRDAIRAELARSGYVLDNIAAGLRGSGTKIIGLVIPDVSNTYFPEITAGIEAAAAASGYWVTLAHSHEDYALECQAITMLCGFRVEGLIIAPAGSQQEVDIYGKLDQARLPYVFIDRLKPKVDTASVMTDVRAGAAALGAYLCSKGYRRWGYLRGPKAVFNTHEHAAGLKKSIAHSGLNIELCEVTAGVEEADGQRAAGALLKKMSSRPDVIVAYNDPVAYGVFTWLKQQGWRVPADMAVAGFSDLKFSSRLEIPLTTVAEATGQMGRQAFALLKRRIDHPAAKPERRKLSPVLMARESA